MPRKPQAAQAAPTTAKPAAKAKAAATTDTPATPAARTVPEKLTVGDIGLCRYSVHAPHLVCPALVTAVRDGAAFVTLFPPAREPHPLHTAIDMFEADPGPARAPCVYPKP